MVRAFAGVASVALCVMSWAIVFGAPMLEPAKVCLVVRGLVERMPLPCVKILSAVMFLETEFFGFQPFSSSPIMETLALVAAKH